MSKLLVDIKKKLCKYCSSSRVHCSGFDERTCYKCGKVQ